MTTPLAWTTKVQLIEQFRAEMNASSESCKGYNAFNLAACYALGFGVRLSLTEAYYYLEEAAKHLYVPAKVLWTAFNYNGLIQDGQSLCSKDEFGQTLEILEKSLLQVNPISRFAARIRAFYKHQSIQMSRCTISSTELGITSQTLGSIKDLLLANVAILHKLTVTVQLDQVADKTPLMYYLIRCHEDFAEVLIRKGVNAEAPTKDHMPLITFACAVGSLRIVRVLLTVLPQLDLQPFSNGISPLHWLFMFDDSEIPVVASLLVKHKASFLANGVAELAEFNLVLSGLPLHWAVMPRSAPAVCALLELGADVNQFSFALLDYLQYPEYAVDLAVCLHMSEMVSLLIKRGAVIHDRPKNSVPPALHYLGDAIDPFRIWLLHGKSYRDAAEQTVQTLLDAGLTIDTRSSDCLTPLQHLVARPNYQTYVIETILNRSPSVTALNDPLRSPIYLASTALQHDRVNSQTFKLILDYCQAQLDGDEFSNACRETLRNCTQDGTLAVAVEILKSLGKDSKTVIESEQLLHLAAEHDQIDMIELFLNEGVDIDRDEKGTPAACAAAKGKKAALKLLLSREATILSMPARHFGDTLLHEAVGPMMSSPLSSSTLAFLCENFRELLIPVVNNFNSFGFTALHEAIVWGNI